MADIIRATTDHDFGLVLGLIRLMAEWDARESQAYGVPAEIVLDVIYQETMESLTAEFGPGGQVMLLAKEGDLAAGCIGFSVDPDGMAEIHKLFVHPDCRGTGLGAILLRGALAMIDGSPATITRLHTANFMANAIRLYQAHGFVPCPPYRETPPEFAKIDVFMQRQRKVT